MVQQALLEGGAAANVATQPEERAKPVAKASRNQVKSIDTAGLPVNSPVGMMLAALQKGATPEQISKMLDLQERWEANEARKAFNEAFAQFKSHAIEVLKTKEVDYEKRSGDRTYYKHAELADVVEAVTPVLSMYGLSSNWTPTQEKGWITITCVLRHRLGHSETVSLSGPPDDSGGKNPVQAISSTCTYLERYTLKAICGIAEKGDDDDGRGGNNGQVFDTDLPLARQAGGTHGGASEQQQAPTRDPNAKPPYPDDEFSANLPKWRDAISTKRVTADQIIARSSTKYEWSAKQQEQLRSKTNPPTGTNHKQQNNQKEEAIQ